MMDRTTITPGRFEHVEPGTRLDLWIDPGDLAVMIRQERRGLSVCSCPTSALDARSVDLLIDWLRNARKAMDFVNPPNSKGD